jgi:hypothetical protein
MRLRLTAKSAIVAFAAALAATAVLAMEAHAPAATNPGFEKMTSLVGEWAGTVDDGGKKMPVTASYRLVSNGTALEETLKTPEDMDMITMYVADGKSLAMTHYCAEGNQPRMRAAVPAGSVTKLDFQYVDATNLDGDGASHMHALVVIFKDADHFSQAWTHRVDGKDQTGVFEFERKK